ncbi:MAG: hypothetical protein QG622_67 [Actinomycetota bacterium]|nr:hypothetical protein [Actinomycetota bacterium]
MAVDVPDGPTERTGPVPQPDLPVIRTAPIEEFERIADRYPVFRIVPDPAGER